MSKVYVYKSSWDFGLQIRPGGKKGVPDGAGGFSHMVEVSPVYVPFQNCTLVLDQAMADRLKQPIEIIKEWIESCDGFNKRFYRVDDIPEDKLDELKTAESKTQVRHGVRATSK